MCMRVCMRVCNQVMMVLNKKYSKPVRSTYTARYSEKFFADL